mgnify:CR=1 FL=1
MTTTYTVLDAAGSIEDSDLTIDAAARCVMSYDGHDFAIEPAADGRGFDLFVTEFSRNSTLGGRPMVKSRIFSLADTREAAEADIFKQVIDHADWWKGMEVLTDADYAEREAEFMADA